MLEQTILYYTDRPRSSLQRIKAAVTRTPTTCRDETYGPCIRVPKNSQLYKKTQDLLVTDAQELLVSPAMSFCTGPVSIFHLTGGAKRVPVILIKNQRESIPLESIQAVEER